MIMLNVTRAIGGTEIAEYYEECEWLTLSLLDELFLIAPISIWNTPRSDPLPDGPVVREVDI